MKVVHTTTLLTVMMMVTSCGSEQSFEERTPASDPFTETDDNDSLRSGGAGNTCLASVSCDGTASDQTDEQQPDPNALPPSETLPPLDSPQEAPAEELDPAAEGDPNIVVFRIVDGTGSGSWNDEGSVITARVGQTIRFVNDDAMAHRLHTNGTPCPHGSRIAPGEQFDCVVTATHDPAEDGVLYDHMAGQRAEVWIETLPSEAS